jgi:hypothetical protein
MHKLGLVCQKPVLVDRFAMFTPGTKEATWQQCQTSSRTMSKVREAQDPVALCSSCIADAWRTTAVTSFVVVGGDSKALSIYRSHTRIMAVTTALDALSTPPSYACTLAHSELSWWKFKSFLYLGPVSHASNRGVNSTALSCDGRPMDDAFLPGVIRGVKHTVEMTLVTTCNRPSYPSSDPQLSFLPLSYCFALREAAATPHRW